MNMHDRSGLLGVVVAMVAVAIATGCPGTQAVPSPKCSTVQLPPDPLGAPSPHAGRASVRVEARGSYLAAIIRRIVSQLRPDDPSATSGVELGSIRLSEDSSASPHKNFVMLQFSAWIRGQDGSHVMLPSRTYVLRLQVLPHLLTDQNTPDLTTRRAFLGCAADVPCELGLVVAFSFDALLGGGTRAATEPVDCTRPGFDLIDEQVLARSLEATAGLPPVGVALDGVMMGLRSRLTLNVHAIGMALGTDRDLVIGLLLDGGDPAPFDSFAWELSRASDADWAIGLDTTLLAPAIRAKVIELATSRISGVSVAGPPSISFGADGINVGLGGTFPAPVCGAVPFSASALAVPGVCGDTLGACTNTHDHPIAVSTSPQGAQATCLDMARFVGTVADTINGMVMALIGGKPAGAPPPASCMAITPSLRYEIGDHDIVYPLRLDTDDAFVVVGRSQLMDNLHPGRTPAPTSGCSW